MSHLLTINNLDLSGWVARRRYSANHSDVYTEWDDVNKVTHRTVIRQRVNASARLVFFSNSDFESFKTAVTSGTVNQVTLYVGTLGEEKTINAFISYTVKNVWTTPTFGQVVAVHQVDLRIVEQ